MNRVLWLLDIAVEIEDGKPVIWMWCKDRDGLTYLVKQRYSLSFYILTNKRREVVEYLTAQGIRVEEVDRKIKGRNVKAIKVYLDVEDIETAAKKIVKDLRDIELYEEDVRPSIKYLIENNLRPSGGLRIEDRIVDDEPIKTLEADKIEYVSDTIPPPLHVLSLDIVYYSVSGSPRPDRDPIILISLTTSRGLKTQLTGDEEKILREFLKIIEEEDPDVIVGFSTNRIHWSYLLERAKRYGLSLSLGRLGSEPHTSIYGHVSIRGRLNIDLEDMVRDIPELIVETLEEFTAYLGLEHEFDKVEDWKVAEVWMKEPERVKKFSSQRAEAMLKCYEVLKDYIFSLSELTGMPADYVLTASTGFRVENYLMYLAFEKGELIPKRPEISHVSYTGGLVQSPKPGIHQDVAVADFRSMYPSIMIKYNISFDTLSEDGEYISPNNFRFKREPEGFLPYALKNLINERRKIQERLKNIDQESIEARVLNARQRAVKVITNAVYGYTGWSGARWYTREVAEATTSWGRQVISESIKKAEELGMNVIYSDTDSLFLKNYSGKLDLFLRWIEENLELEVKVEKIYKRILFTEAKKKYAGIREDSKMDIVGLEAVRGDWSLIAREVQEETVKTLLETGDVSEALNTIRKYVRKIMNREVRLEELILWKQITRPIEEYEATQPHIVVARQLMMEGWRIQPGDKVGYIIVKGAGPLYKRVKPYFKVDRDEVDWEYYRDKQVLSACMRILEPLGVKLEELKKTSEATLTDFF
ncbi:MAG: DNA-directed DNA polymerase [Candidatus Caldarchaeales archaeon]